jgi:hypothetical protein
MQHDQLPKAAVGAAAALVLLVGLSSCAAGGSGVVYNSNFTAGYDPRSLGAAMSRAPLLVETYGSPAANLAQESISRSTALALRQYGSPWLPRNYTDSAADAGTAPYRLRIAYGVPKAFNRQQLCEDSMSTQAIETVRGSTDGGSSRTLAALCRGDNALGVAEGSPGGGADITGEPFMRFVGLLGREVMPRTNPVLDDDCIFRACD